MIINMEIAKQTKTAMYKEGPGRIAVETFQ